MNVKQHLMEHAFCMPRGTLGRVGGWLMSRDCELPAQVLDLLEVGSTHELLEIGVGPGVGLKLAADRAHQGRVVGIDVSQTMLEMAARRNRAQIDAGRVVLHHSAVERLPFRDGSFDAAMAINAVHLWPDPVGGLCEVRRTLRSGGRIAVAFSRFSNVVLETFETYLVDAGYVAISTVRGESGPCLLGRV